MSGFDPESVANLSRATLEEAAGSIAQDALRTPVLPQFANGSATGVVIKAENLQPLGAFKIRGAARAASMIDARRVATASAGNFAQGLALACQRRGLELTVHVPQTAARVKVAALRKLGAGVVEHPFDDWWQIMSTRNTGADDGHFVHPVCEQSVIEGNATIGLELAEQVPDMQVVVVPFGGGGLISGIALALRACGRRVRIVAVEVETATPLAAARAAGRPVKVTRHPSFVDGIGSTQVLDPMWPLLSDLVDEVVVVSLDDVRASLRSAALENHLVLEGAGAAALAAAQRFAGQRVCAVASGGNIDPAVLNAELG